MSIEITKILERPANSAPSVALLYTRALLFAEELNRAIPSCRMRDVAVMNLKRVLEICEDAARGRDECECREKQLELDFSEKPGYARRVVNSHSVLETGVKG